MLKHSNYFLKGMTTNMANTRTLIKSGSGTSTGTTTTAVTANTITKTDATLVTLPTDPGYEYDVYISGYAQWIVANTTNTTGSGFISIGHNTYRTTCIQATVGLVTTVGYSGAGAVAGTAGVQTKESIPWTSASTEAETSALVKMRAGPGTAIVANMVLNNESTAAFASSANTGVFYFQYTYIGRKTITESF